MAAEAPDVADDAWSAAIAAAILRRGSLLHTASLVLTLAALIAGAATRPGGAWLVRSEQGRAGVQGKVRSLDPPHSLQLTWRWDGEAAEDLVDIELTQQQDGTSVTVRHRTAATGAGDYRQGWEFVLANLAASLRA